MCAFIWGFVYPSQYIVDLRAGDTKSCFPSCVDEVKQSVLSSLEVISGDYGSLVRLHFYVSRCEESVFFIAFGEFLADGGID